MAESDAREKGDAQPVGSVYVEVYLDATLALSQLVTDWSDESKRKLLDNDPDVLEHLRQECGRVALERPSTVKVDVFSVSMRDASRGDG